MPPAHAPASLALIYPQPLLAHAVGVIPTLDRAGVLAVEDRAARGLGAGSPEGSTERRG